MKKDIKIAIVGAGISGLAAAHALKKLGYKNITIFEARDRVGGQIYTIKKDGYLYELGAIFTLEQFKTIKELVNEYTITLYKRPDASRICSDGKPISMIKYMHDKYGIYEICKAQFNLFRLLCKHRNIRTPGFSNIDPELYENFKDFAGKNGLKPFAYIFEPSMIGFGYGYIDQTPTLYYLKMLSRTIKYAIQDQLNGLLGWNLGGMQLFEKGFQNFLETIAKDFKVLLGAKVTRIKREETGGLLAVNITAKGKTERFDCVIISSTPVHTTEFLDLDNAEKEIFSRVKFYYFQDSVFYADGIPAGGSLIFADSAKIKGFPGTISNLHPDHNIYQSWQLHQGEISAGELKQKLVEVVNSIGGNLKEIIMTETFPYFPHFSEKDLMEMQPYKFLEQLQGKKVTSFLGGLFNFESVEHNAEYAKWIINKHFA